MTYGCFFSDGETERSGLVSISKHILFSLLWYLPASQHVGASLVTVSHPSCCEDLRI